MCKRKLISILTGTVLALSSLTACASTAAPKEAAAPQENQEVKESEQAAGETTGGAAGFAEAGGWHECLYAVIDGVKRKDVTAVSYSGAAVGNLEGDDLEYLVRDDKNGGVRIDIPALAAGAYDLSVTAGGSEYRQDGIEVTSFDRSGYAHFKYDRGVGAYNDDGTLKDGAIVLYVTDENKNDVELTLGDITVRGIGNILNSGGLASEDNVSDDGIARTSKGGLANTNQGVIKALADAGVPLVVRFIGTVSDTGLYEHGEYDPEIYGRIEGLTSFSLEKELVEAQGGELVYDYGANPGDNGHMARMVSGRDITLEGIGNDAVIDGWGFHFIAASSDQDTDRGESFEVRNLSFINTAEDAVGIEGNSEKNEEGKDDVSCPFTRSAERIWIHNNEFHRPALTNCAAAEGDKLEGDGSIDIKKGQYATFAYNLFDRTHKSSLVGGNDNANQFNITYHHNLFSECESRAPLSRNANIHMYNNIFDKQSGYCENVRMTGYIFSEYNMFNACRNPYWIRDDAGAIKSYMDRLTDEYYEDMEDAVPVTVVGSRDEYVPNGCGYIAGGISYDKFDTDPELSYIPAQDYVLQTDYEELKRVIDEETGAMK